MELLNRLRRRVVNLIFPRRCVFCRHFLPLDAETAVCTECMDELPFCLSYNRCKDCGRPIPEEKAVCSHCGREQHFYHKISAAYLYEDSVRQALLRFKRERYRSYAVIFAEHIAAVLTHDCPSLGFDLVVAVPPRLERMQLQDYDQAWTLAKAVAQQLGLPCTGGILRQIEHRKKQSSLSYEERHLNVRGNIRVVKEKAILGKRILLVDDISTTGATLDECVKVLRQAGAEAVFCAVAAMVPGD